MVLVQSGLNWFKLVPYGSNRFKVIQNGSKRFKTRSIWNKLVRWKHQNIRNLTKVENDKINCKEFNKYSKLHQQIVIGFFFLARFDIFMLRFQNYKLGKIERLKRGVWFAEISWSREIVHSRWRVSTCKTARFNILQFEIHMARSQIYM